LSGTTILVFLFVAVLIVVGLWFGAKRKKELAAWATKAGLTFTPRSDRTFDDRYPESGSWNSRPLEAFDYRYVTGSGKHRSTHVFSAVILGSGLSLKPLQIRSENVFDKLTEFFGVDDIDFESAQFSREFHVKSPDKKWAYDVLHQRTMEFLLNSPKFSIEFDSEHVVCWRNRRFDLQARESAIAVVEGILDRLPEYLVRAQRGGN